MGLEFKALAEGPGSTSTSMSFETLVIAACVFDCRAGRRSRRRGLPDERRQ